MPFTIKDIDKILNINKLVEKSKITSLYNCVPRGCEVFTGFEQSRNSDLKNTQWSYWKNLIQYVLEKNCDFIYLLNSPKRLEIENPNFNKQLETLELLLGELRKIGVNKLRVASLQLMNFIGKNYPDFKILASTSLEYKIISEYQNFLNFHPEVIQIVPSHDLNKNFDLLKNIQKKYPKIEIELIVNEGCIQGCPNRYIHASSRIDKGTTINNELSLSDGYATSFCGNITEKYPLQSFVLSNNIFPWNIKEYSKIGINNFKFVGRDVFLIYSTQMYIDRYCLYLKGVDNISNIKDYPLSHFIHRLTGIPAYNQLTVNCFKKYLPDIKHFIKKGHLCASRCDVECKYCYKCADKIQKVFLKKQKDKEKIPSRVSACCIN